MFLMGFRAFKRAAKLQAVKVEDWKKIPALDRNLTTQVGPGSSPSRSNHLQSVIDHNFAAF